jgi:hypothetical protein
MQTDTNKIVLDLRVIAGALMPARCLLCPLTNPGKIQNNLEKKQNMLHCLFSTNVVGDWLRKLLLLLHCSTLVLDGLN